MSKKIPAEIRSITIFCPNKQEEITIPIKNISFWSDSSECDICGTHVTITCSVVCLCGKHQYHDIVIREW
jgi:hypothetical protein